MTTWAGWLVVGGVAGLLVILDVFVPCLYVVLVSFLHASCCICKFAYECLLSFVLAFVFGMSCAGRMTGGDGWAAMDMQVDAF